MDVFTEALRRIQSAVAVMGDGPEIREHLHRELVVDMGSDALVLTEEQFFLAWCGARTEVTVPAPYAKDPPWVKIRR